MFQLNADLTRGLDLISSRHQELKNKIQNSVSSAKLADDVLHIEKSTQQSFTFFFRAVTTNVEKALDAKQQKITQQLAEKQIEQQENRAQNSANNILNFIETQLNIDKEHGADESKLNSRLDAALQGFEQGFQEASEILKELQLMSPELENELALTAGKVTLGIDDLRNNFVKPNSPDVKELIDNSELIVSTEQLQAEESKSFEFELTTTDGDKVSINVASHFSADTRLDVRQSSKQQTFSVSNEELFSFSVDGELDEQERKAITNLLNDVTSLANDFYFGDVETAFNKAISLGYDETQISEFAVNLTHVKNFTAYKAYQTDKPLFNATTVNQFKPLADFSNQLQQMISELSQNFLQPKELLSSVMQPINELIRPADHPSVKVDFWQYSQQLLTTFEQMQQVG